MFKDVKAMIGKLNSIKNLHIVLLTGNLGAGKTYFVINYMRETYGFEGVTSPTYSACNTYVTSSGIMVKHFDFYLKYNPYELQIAVEEASLIFIEWWEPHMISEYRCVEINCELETIVQL